MAKSKQQSLQIRPRPKRGLVLVAVGFALVSYGLWGFWQKYQATNNSNPTIPAEVVTYSTDRPDETDPGAACDNFQVADGLPRKIELPSLGVSGCIQQVGVDQENKIAVPTNIHVAGWFVDSAKPGQPGVSIIDGHVQGYYREGIFKHLGTLNPGDKVVIEYGGGDTKEFQVISNDSYSVEDAAKEQFKQIEGADSQLTLITCGGNFDRASDSYDQRVLVRAKLP